MSEAAAHQGEAPGAEILRRLDQAEARLLEKYPRAAKDPELAAFLSCIRDEARMLAEPGDPLCDVCGNYNGSVCRYCA